MNHDFILLDRSGSMDHNNLYVEAVSSVNAYVERLAADKVDTGVTLITFDSGNNAELSFEIIRDRIIPSTWRKVTPDEAKPRGGTPLNDAIGRMVALARQGGYSKVAVVIMTDGAENSSKEYSTTAAKSLLDGCRREGWQVVFLGANFDNIAQAASYGNAVGQSFTSSTANMMASGAITAGKMSDWRTKGQSVSYTAEEKKALASDTPIDPTLGAETQGG